MKKYVTVCRADCLQFLYKKLSHLASDRKEPYPSSPGYLLHARAATVLQSYLPASLSCGRTPAVYFLLIRRNLVVAPRLIELIGVGLLVIAVLQLHQSCQGNNVSIMCKAESSRVSTRSNSLVGSGNECSPASVWRLPPSVRWSWAKHRRTRSSCSCVSAKCRITLASQKYHRTITLLLHVLHVRGYRIKTADLVPPDSHVYGQTLYRRKVSSSDVRDEHGSSLNLRNSSYQGPLCEVNFMASCV